MISNNVVYLTIADKSYPRKLAFSFLDELSKEFQNSYGAKVDTVRKPYAFVSFGEPTPSILFGSARNACPEPFEGSECILLDCAHAFYGFHAIVPHTPGSFRHAHVLTISVLTHLRKG